jgi:hypothetical protein
MLLRILDANAQPQTIVTPAQEAVVDHSGEIAATSYSQMAMDANALRSGWIMQNIGSSVIYVSELGPADTLPGTFRVDPGAFFPPSGFPLTTGAIHVNGTTGNGYTMREW